MQYNVKTNYQCWHNSSRGLVYHSLLYCWLLSHACGGLYFEILEQRSYFLWKLKGTECLHDSWPFRVFYICYSYICCNLLSLIVFCNNVFFLFFITCTALWLDQKSLLNVLYCDLIWFDNLMNSLKPIIKLFLLSTIVEYSLISTFFVLFYAHFNISISPNRCDCL